MNRMRRYTVEPESHAHTAANARMIDVAVIGLGRIASGYDEQVPAAEVPRSHIGAVRLTGGVRLVAAIEPDATRRQAVQEHWRDDGILFVDTIENLPEANFDAFVICTPAGGREEVFDAALKLRPKVVIVEKPLARTLEAAQRMAAAATQAGTALYVNFHRRFDPRHHTLRQLATTQSMAQIVATYNNGAHNYASHAVDLLLDWFGPVDRVQALGAMPEREDPNLSFACRMASGLDTLVLGIDGLDYDLFDIQFYGADTRLDLLAGGARMERREAAADRFYPGYRHLGDACPVLTDGPVGGLCEMYQSLRDHLIKSTPFEACTAAQAIDGLAVLQAALMSSENGGCPVDPRDLTGAPLA